MNEAAQSRAKYWKATPRARQDKTFHKTDIDSRITRRQVDVESRVWLECSSSRTPAKDKGTVLLAHKGTEKDTHFLIALERERIPEPQFFVSVARIRVIA